MAPLPFAVLLKTQAAESIGYFWLLVFTLFQMLGFATSLAIILIVEILHVSSSTPFLWDAMSSSAQVCNTYTCLIDPWMGHDLWVPGFVHTPMGPGCCTFNFHAAPSMLSWHGCTCLAPLEAICIVPSWDDWHAQSAFLFCLMEAIGGSPKRRTESRLHLPLNKQPFTVTWRERTMRLHISISNTCIMTRSRTASSKIMSTNYYSRLIYI